MRWLWVPVVLWLTGPTLAADLPTVRLGVVVPTAADGGPAAQSMRRAAAMALSDWIPRLARKIELAFTEDAFDPRQAAVIAERLIQQGVWGVVGHFFSSSSVAASVVYHAAGVPQVIPTATHPRLTTQGFDRLFRIAGRDDQQAVVAADFVLSRLKATRVAVVHDRTEYGRGLVEAFQRERMRRGARPVVAAETLQQGDADFGAQVRRLNEAEPDAIYFGGVFREAAHLLRQYRRTGLRAAFIGGDAVLDPEFVRLAGEAIAEGAYLTFAPDPEQVVSARTLVRSYTSRYGHLGPHVLNTYAAVDVLLAAVRDAKPASNDKDELGKIARAIRAGTQEGVLGRFGWDRSGDRTPPPYAVYVTKRGGRLQGWFEQLPDTAPDSGDAAPK